MTLTTKKTPKFNFLIPTVGRVSLFDTLSSINSDANENDCITVVADKNSDDVEKILTLLDFKCQIKYFKTEKNLGYGGFPVRSLYQNDLSGDYILHCDDDNVYLPGAINTIRQTILDDTKEQSYLFRVALFKQKDLVWRRPSIHHIKPGHVDTACGVLLNSQDYPDWPLYQWGDGLFYQELVKQRRKIKLVDKVIYHWRPNQSRKDYFESDEHKKHAEAFRQYH